MSTESPQTHSVFTHRHYSEILRCALVSGYRFIGFNELDEWRSRDDRSCVLRHDCDNDLVAAVQMASIEHDAGVASTYCLMLTSPMYNLLAPPNVRLVERIIAAGHRIGLHFDELAYPDARADEIPAFVDSEADSVRAHLGIEVDVVTFHQPSTAVLDGTIRTSMLNSYDKEHLAGFYYISDSNTVWREGCACEVFPSGRYQRMQLLIHPEWWTEDDMTIRDKWNLMFEHNFDTNQDSMLVRERAYQWKQHLRFEVDGESR